MPKSASLLTATRHALKETRRNSSCSGAPSSSRMETELPHLRACSPRPEGRGDPRTARFSPYLWRWPGDYTHVPAERRRKRRCIGTTPSNSPHPQPHHPHSVISVTHHGGKRRPFPPHFHPCTHSVESITHSNLEAATVIKVSEIRY